MAGWLPHSRISWIKLMSNTNTINVDTVLSAFYEVAEAQSWHQNHSPRKLASAISVEAAELLREFQWLGDEDSLTETRVAAVASEVADVLMYALVLCDKLEIDVAEALKQKIADNRQRFM